VAIIRPFKALRPIAGHAEQVSCVPYDVVHESEVRDFIRRHPNSFLKVTRAEGEFPENTSPSEHEVFARARHNLRSFIQSNIYALDDVDAFYVYRLDTHSHSQTGVVACCSLDEYEAGVIKKHENVRPDRVRERTQHLLAVQAQTGLILLAFRNTDEIGTLIAKAVVHEPIYDFPCMDGVRQRMWRVAETGPLIRAFASVPALYIADGHHRVESARLAREAMRSANPLHTGDEDYNFVLAGLFPAEELQILAYNRAVKDLNGMSPEDLITRICETFFVEKTDRDTPLRHGEICMYMDGQWFSLEHRDLTSLDIDPISRLDVSILQNYLLSPLLGIDDPTTDHRIVFVGGAKRAAELRRMVDAGEARAAFSLFPTGIDDLMTVSDMGDIMPPKSTWFEPKLKDGLLVHQI
jgi:uncharacterized protein (DUF1015 family)